MRSAPAAFGRLGTGAGSLLGPTHIPAVLVRTFTSTAPVSYKRKPLNVLYLGAGSINFGTTEAGWNHSTRLEKKLGRRLNVLGIVDQDEERAQKIIAQKRSEHGGSDAYAATRVFSNLSEVKDQLGALGKGMPRLIVNGLPASVRGSAAAGRDVDLQAARLFPRAAHFVEKPISEDENIKDVRKVAKKLGNKVVSVGYMSRYLKGVQEIKRIIDEKQLKVTAVLGVYLMAYKWAGERPVGYWSLEREAGPVVTQGTHFVDLMRYFCPDPDFSTLAVQTVEAADPNGDLGALTDSQSLAVTPEHTIPRYTNASWRSQDGALMSLLHGVALHEGDFDSSLTVLADGWKFRLVDTYSPAPRLFIRGPGDLAEKETKYKKDDPYYTELSTLVDIIDGKHDKSAILTDFTDALETYKLTWAIRRTGEASARERGAKP